MSFRLIIRCVWLGVLAVGVGALHVEASGPPVLPDSEPLDWQGDIASRMVDGIDRFLLSETANAAADRRRQFQLDTATPERREASLESCRRRLAHIVGVRERRVEFDGLELLATTSRPALIAQAEGYRVFAVRWPVLDGVHAEGLLLTPDGEPVADIVAIPHVEHTPEMIAGLVEGVEPTSQYARRLAESGCRVLVPAVVGRRIEQHGRAKLSNREWIYRFSFELGRHPIGYDVQKVLAAVDWFVKEAGADDPRVGVIGWGDGGLLAMVSAALDPRIDAVVVSGYFDQRDNLWQEPIDRNLFGLLRQFADAELAAMIVPRTLVIEGAAGPEGELARGTVGAPGRLVSPRLDDVRREAQRIGQLVGAAPVSGKMRLIASDDGQGPCGSPEVLAALLDGLAPGATLTPLGKSPLGETVDMIARERRQIDELQRHGQRLLDESVDVRKAFWANLDCQSLERFAETVELYRKHFYDELIGRFDQPRLPPRPRSRRILDEPTWTGYEVALDVFPDVFAYGILLLPKDIKPGEKRPVVVCQHGLEGQATDMLAGGREAYHGLATRLAERGFIVFSPQNPYRGGDRFRSLQRKANPIGKTLFSIIVPQHQQIVDWLSTLPEVDPARIAFYGLSYGGKSAMRIPPLVKNYCLSICSGDFNDWIAKTTSTRQPQSYVWTGEYEIWEFDLGSSFNYAEMAALIAPRPFMVERGHFDSCAADEHVAAEYAKVRRLYQTQLDIGERTEIEWFNGPHEIHAVGTLAFLHKHLDWPAPKPGE